MTWRRKKAPVPGTASPPMRPAPAPAIPPRHGGVNFAIAARECTVTAWNCGRWLVWDARGQVVFARECRCPRGRDWHQWEQEFAQ